MTGPADSPSRRTPLAALALGAALAGAGCGGAGASATDASATDPAGEVPEPAAAPIPHPADCAQETEAPEAAALRFLEALTPALREAAVFPSGEPTRSRWSNLPVGILDYRPNGARLGDLDESQRGALFRLLASMLSPRGCAVTLGVVSAEGALAESPRAARLGWGADNYYLAVFGEPSDDSRWGLQFGGHHLAVNLTRIAGETYLSPTFVGIEPAEHEREGQTLAPLRPFAEAGLAVVASLDEAERGTALLPSRPDDILTGAGTDGVVPPFAGSSAATWSGDRRQRLLDAAHLWVGMLPAEDAEARMAEAHADLDETWFAWQGDPEGDGPIYYRIHGPRLLVEFSTQGDLGSDRGHYHSIYRDPTNEYGASAGGPADEETR